MRIRKEVKSLITALLLFVCVAASTMILIEQMTPFLPSDKGAIAFIDDVVTAEDMLKEHLQKEEVGSHGTNPDNSNVEAEQPEAEVDETPAQTPSADSDIRPEMETMDGTVVWEKESEVEIFKVSYENETGEVTVQSADGDKVIAPGTSNSYTFRLKNTGNYAIDYKVEMESLVTASNTQIPIESRISRYDGKWLLGTAEDYVDLEEFHAIDNGTVGPGKFIYYTLDWVWPFEGDDSLDTMLGNLSVEQDFSFEIVLRTEAVLNGNPEADGGLKAPQMGDNSRMAIWITVAAVSLLAIFFLLITRRRDDEEEEELQVEGKEIE